MQTPNAARIAAIECHLKCVTEELAVLKGQAPAADAFAEIKKLFDTGVIVISPETPRDVCQRLDQLLENK